MLPLSHPSLLSLVPHLSLISFQSPSLLVTEGEVKEATSTLALLVRKPITDETVVKEEMAVAGLIRMMRQGTPKGKKNVVVALLELCRCGQETWTEAREPTLASLLPTLLFTGMKQGRNR